MVVKLVLTGYFPLVSEQLSDICGYVEGQVGEEILNGTQQQD